jgi:bacterioferritin-associated ferredoxin
MIVCMCRNVSDRAVAAAVHAGARTVADVARATGGAGSACGCCSSTIEEMLPARSPCSATPCPGCPNAGHQRAA